MKRKKESCKAAEVHQYQKKMIVALWVWLCACESRGRIETHPRWGGKGLAAILLLHPGDWLWMRGKHTDLKGRVSAQDRGWNKTEKTLPRTKGCLLPSPSRGLWTFCSTFSASAFHSHYCTYWFPCLLFAPKSRLCTSPGQGLAFYKRSMNEWTSKGRNWILFKPL